MTLKRAFPPKSKKLNFEFIKQCCIEKNNTNIYRLTTHTVYINKQQKKREKNSKNEKTLQKQYKQLLRVM